ncbi:hypothetical protein, partial [Streptomyces alanosinicus]|uniref:hypothetical protein n=1 Tax=Streptomyces alanosinicus TaxID=68171 RepID=UPI0016722E06
MRIRKSLAVAATAIALCGIGMSAPAANAAARPMAECNAPWNDVGAPGNLYGYGFYYGKWTYAGQV